MGSWLLHGIILAMARNRVVLLVLALASIGAIALGAPGEELALRLEAIPDTTDVLVVGSWTTDFVQGWSYGVCYDPATVRLADCGVNEFQACDSPDCPSIQCGTDLAEQVLDGNDPCDFQLTNVFQNGVARAVAFICPVTFYLPPRERFEMLRISFELLEPQAHLSFCGTLGQPPVEVAIVAAGFTLMPTTLEGVTVGADTPFVRGDANADGGVNVADAVYVLQYIFLAGSAPSCQKAADGNDDGDLNVADAIVILGYLFMHSSPFPPPFPACGVDTTDDNLHCHAFTPCR